MIENESEKTCTGGVAPDQSMDANDEERDQIKT
jgi:hypothetical protein